MKGRVISWLLYVGVGLFFGVAALLKILDPEAFLSSLLTYRVFTYQQSVALAYFAPVLEMVVALCLLSGIWRKGAALLTTLMLFFFIALVLQGFVRGLEMDCGCFGENQLQGTTDYLLKIGQNLLLLLAVVVAWLIEVKSQASKRIHDQSK